MNGVVDIHAQEGVALSDTKAKRKKAQKLKNKPLDEPSNYIDYTATEDPQEVSQSSMGTPTKKSEQKAAAALPVLSEPDVVYVPPDADPMPTNSVKKKMSNKKTKHQPHEPPEEYQIEAIEASDFTDRTEDLTEMAGYDMSTPVSPKRNKKKKAKKEMTALVEAVEEFQDEPTAELPKRARKSKKIRHKEPEGFLLEPSSSSYSKEVLDAGAEDGMETQQHKTKKSKKLKKNKTLVDYPREGQDLPVEPTSSSLEAAQSAEPVGRRRTSSIKRAPPFVDDRPAEPSAVATEVRKHKEPQLDKTNSNNLVDAVNHPRRDRKKHKESSNFDPGAYSVALDPNAGNPEALGHSVGTEVARSRQQRKDHKANQAVRMESMNTRIEHARAKHGLHNPSPSQRNNATGLGDSSSNYKVSRTDYRNSGTNSAGPFDHWHLLREPSQTAINNSRRSSNLLTPASPSTIHSPDLISAELVSDFDELGGITRESLYRQAQEDGARQAREDLLNDVLVAEEVIDEAALKQRQRRQWIACGACFILVVILSAVLGAQPWKTNSSGSAVLAPVNDLCTGALALSSDAVELGSTQGASPVGFDSCTSSVMSNGLGVWYNIQGTGRPIRVSTCDSNSTESYDTQITLFQGTCKDHVCVGGNDNGIDDSCGVFSSLTFPSEVGKNYILCVHGKFLASASDNTNTDGLVAGIPMAGNFVLTVDEPVINDFCEGAATAEVGAALLGSTEDATSDTQVSFCHGTEASAPGVWYRMEGTGGILQALITPNATTNFAVTVYEGQIGQINNQREDCRNLRCIAGYDDPFGFESHVTFATQEETIYYILVHGVDGQRGGFKLLVQETADNDLCERAISIKDDPRIVTSVPFDGGLVHELQGSTELATFSGRAQFGASCQGVLATGAGVWFALMGTGGTMVATTCIGRSNDTLDTSLLVFEGEDCRNLVCVGGDDRVCERQSWSSTNGTRYFLLVSGKLKEKGSFVLSIESSSSP